MRLVFVCTANMCRSPLAAGLCARALATRGMSGFEVSSAGVFAVHGRPATPAAVRVAKGLGLDLGAHSSQPFEVRELGARDSILVMEEAHRRHLLAAFKVDPATVHLLGTFAPDGPREIDDPVGGPDIAYQQCVLRLERCIAGLLDGLQSRAKAGH